MPGSSMQPWQVMPLLLFQQHMDRSPAIIGAAYPIQAGAVC